jgi:GDPmannose 4,6-dehydratase
MKILVTGGAVTTTIRKFVQMAFAEIGITIECKGENENEVGFVAALNEAKLKEFEIAADCKLQIG